MSKWISVKDRLPSQYDLVLTYGTDGYQIAVLDASGQRWTMEGWEAPLKAVGHWMLVPKRPRE